MGKKALPFLLSSMVIYLGLCAIELFLFRPIIELLTLHFFGQFFIYLGLFIAVNPFIDKCILKLLPFGYEEKKIKMPYDD